MPFALKFVLNIDKTKIICRIAFMRNGILYLLIFCFISLYSCNKKYITDIKKEIVNDNNKNLKTYFNELDNKHKITKLSIDFYKNIILKHITSGRYIELLDIIEIDYFLPGYLNFIVYWRTGEGYVYKLYTFNDEQKITEIYNLNNGWPSPYMKILMEKIKGEKFGDYMIISDINNDNLNEIIAFSFGSFGNLFSVYGFDMINNNIKKLCEIEYYFNYDNPFPPIENENNIIKILEIIDKENYDLVWNEYIWDEIEREYIKR
jgi:hypothetical protein